MTIVADLLTCKGSVGILAGSEERLGALRHVCLALPRMAHALHAKVRQLSSAKAQCVLHSTYIDCTVLALLRMGTIAAPRAGASVRVGIK